MKTSAQATIDIVHTQLIKTTSIIDLILMANEHQKLEQNIVHGALWAVSDYLEDLENLFARVDDHQD